MSRMASMAVALAVLVLAASPGASCAATPRDGASTLRTDTDISSARRHTKRARHRPPVQIDVPYRGAPHDSYWGERGKWGGYADTPYPFYPLRPGPF
jgi:hypothetical protein